jgi:hypothetical protein
MVGKVNSWGGHFVSTASSYGLRVTYQYLSAWAFGNQSHPRVCTKYLVLCWSHISRVV